jgi:very-short-patch-repair endonuclease
MSCYEDLCFDTLNYLGIASVRQYRIPQVKKRSYDFGFLLDEQCYIIEIDGEQHFKDINHWKSCKSEQHINDCMKQISALILGFKVIRIHYKDIGNIMHHIKDALLILHNTDKYVYYSSPINYEWIADIYLTCVMTNAGHIRKNYIKRYIKKRYVLDVMNVIPSKRNILLNM